MSQKSTASFFIPSSTSTTERRNNDEDKNSEHGLYSFYKPNKNRASRSVPSRRIQSPYLDPNLDDSTFAEDDRGPSNNNNTHTSVIMQKKKPLPPVPPKSSSFAVIETRKGGSLQQAHAPPPLPTAPKPKLIPKGRSRTASSEEDAEYTPPTSRLSKSTSADHKYAIMYYSDEAGHAKFVRLLKLLKKTLKKKMFLFANPLK